MIGPLAFISSTLLVGALAAQPSAPKPPTLPLRELPWGQLNFLHTTDTHGWHAGHLLEPSYSADWGDYISFAHHLRAKADEEGVDLLLVDTGDRIEGNGLYDGSEPKGKYTFEIVKEQDIDVLCSGNHELYQKNSSENEYNKLVPGFGGNYLASNLDIYDPDTGTRVPLAPRYRKFTTKNLGLRILAFGFLFNFRGNYNNTVVQKVEQTVKEEWFQEVIREKDIDLFLVAGHVDIRSEEYTTIFKAIRQVKWDTPIHFFGGHTHIRDYKKFDSKAYALESGRYMETIGFASISGLEPGKSDADVSASGLRYERRYIDNNLFSLHHHAGLNDTTFPTERGTNVSRFIAEARSELGLDKKFGCAPQDLWMNRAKYPSKNSMYTWLEEDVLPDMIRESARHDQPRLVLINTGAMRFDIYKGPFTRDTTYIVSPFTNGFRYLKNVPYQAAKKLILLLNHGGPILEQAFPALQSTALVPPEQLTAKQDVVIENEDGLSYAGWGQTPLKEGTRPTPGYTTRDDAGDEGDDTLHSPISFYRVPNCIQSQADFPEDGSEPGSVDVVFVEFIQPWIILGLNYLGQNVSTENTEAFVKGKDMTTLVAEWVQNNWNGTC
ncbi:Ser/Thr protein phosphatase family [Xylona heveae TC161]|uniref:Ser/Thr protein phosphatase family n=1 Tax=Xylona heveae (strain CBS 132557 / TC161) TaxID=1328760 RepID=A0A165GWN3_XYLHT|nr:Ser/Thr protein phosphatase family [Xylona heveae TC161]KZF22693.1 Ser/Thr protein phosphatase family [Xylona heveae TC161]